MLEQPRSQHDESRCYERRKRKEGRGHAYERRRTHRSLSSHTDSISDSRLRARQVWPTIAARTGHCEKLQAGPFGGCCGLGARITRAFVT
ncbi:hypothetical protein V2G26_009310 [Clonostachys chloroleuca]